MKVNRPGMMVPQQGVEEQTRAAQQPTAVSPLNKALATTAVARDSYNASGLGASAPGAMDGANALQNRPMEVYSGALMASMDQAGLRPDLEKLQTQIVYAILNEVLRSLQMVVSQLGAMMGGGQAPGGGQVPGGGQTPGGGQVPGGGQTPGGGQVPGGGYGGPAPGGGQTPGGGSPTPGGVIDPNVRYQDLSKTERTQMSGMNDRQRAVLHLWGIQMGSAGKQDGGVLFNVLNNPSQFQPAEVEVARELAAKEQSMYGGITGKSLDQAFFGLYKDLTGNDISQRYADAPIRYAQGPVNMANRQTGANGLNQFENEVLQLWGHSPLFTGGKIDGSILQYAMNSKHTMEANLNKGDLQALYNADMASDGVLNGDSLENAMIDVLDRVYKGAPSASAQRTMNDAMEQAAQRRQGLLPPVPLPAAGAPAEPSTIDAVNANQGKKLAGSCPFIGRAA
jgi:hypothetical protein